MVMNVGGDQTADRLICGYVSFKETKPQKKLSCGYIKKYLRETHLEPSLAVALNV